MNYHAFFEANLQKLKDQGSYRYFLEVNKSAQHFPQFYYVNDDAVYRTAVNWCSNDYLCMSIHEEVITKLSFTAHRSGTGSSGTRNISGTTNYHKELEATLATWHKKDAALLFNGAYLANVTTLQTLGRQIPDLVFISDECNHASLVEGMRSTSNKKVVFRHNDVSHLEQILGALSPDQPKIIVFESIYSISGNVAPVRQIISVAKKFKALTYLDEVHAVGLYGKIGAGLLEQEELQSDIDIVNGTLSKAVGVFGGYVAASATIVDFIRSYGKGFIFTTSLPPAVCSAANKSIQLIQTDTQAREAFHDNVQNLREALKQNGVVFTQNASHITSIPIGDAKKCREVAELLLKEQGIYLQPINYPTVRVGEECLRIITTAKHQLKHINHLANSLRKILHGKDQTTGTTLAAIGLPQGGSDS